MNSKILKSKDDNAFPCILSLRLNPRSALNFFTNLTHFDMLTSIESHFFILLNQTKSWTNLCRHLMSKCVKLRKKLTKISNKVIPVHSDAYFLRYDQFNFEKVLLISKYQNNIRFSKKQDKARYLVINNSWDDHGHVN